MQSSGLGTTADVTVASSGSVASESSGSSGPSGPYLEIVTAANHSWRVTVQDLWLLVLLIGLGSSVLLTGARVWADAGGVL